MKTMIVFGTRPEIIKLMPVIHELRTKEIELTLVHTNQHYDKNMDQVFLDELNVGQADHNLQVNSAGHGQMVGQMMVRLEPIMIDEKPNAVIVQGDTNSALAGATVAAKLNINLTHVEAGMRSYDRTMPEEINRVTIDHISDCLLAPTKKEEQILRQEGINSDNIYLVGNTIQDTLQYIQSQVDRSRLKQFSLVENMYVLVTVHRPSNVDSESSLKETIEVLKQAKQLQPNPEFIWPVHPRVKKFLSQYSLQLPSFIKQIEPVGYLDIVTLVNYAKFVITDSGGLQEEAYILETPCITLRNTTEWTYTVENRKNHLVHRNINKLENAIKMIAKKSDSTWKKPYPNNVSKKIVDIIQSKND